MLILYNTYSNIKLYCVFFFCFYIILYVLIFLFAVHVWFAHLYTICSDISVNSGCFV